MISVPEHQPDISMDHQLFEPWLSSNPFGEQNSTTDLPLPDLSAISSVASSPTQSSYSPLSDALVGVEASQPRPDAFPVYYALPLAVHETSVPTLDNRHGFVSSVKPVMPHDMSHSPAAYVAAQAQETYSQRRRAQNRAAQRAFRERKERHAKELEQQLAELGERYRGLETRYKDLEGSYQKLRSAVGLLTAEGKEEEEWDGFDQSHKDLMRTLLDILDGQMKPLGKDAHEQTN